MLHISWYLYVAFQSNVGCFNVGPPNIGAVCTGLALLTILSAFVPMMSALVASITECIAAYVKLCSVAILVWLTQDLLVWVCQYLLFHYSMCLAWIKYLTIYIQEYIYIELLYVQLAQLWICILVCYWLLIVWYIIGWMYFIWDIHLCGYYVITDILMSMFMSYHNSKVEFKKYTCDVLLPTRHLTHPTTK